MDEEEFESKGMNMKKNSIKLIPRECLNVIADFYNALSAIKQMPDLERIYKIAGEAQQKFLDLISSKNIPCVQWKKKDRELKRKMDKVIFKPLDTQLCKKPDSLVLAVDLKKKSLIQYHHKNCPCWICHSEKYMRENK